MDVNTTTKKQPKSSKQASKTTGKVDGGAPAVLDCSWRLLDVLSDKVAWERWAVDNTVQLLEEDNTVPFIARYRKEKTNNMEADKIRQVKEELDILKAVQSKISTVYKAVDKLGQVKVQWKKALASAQTMDEVEHLYAPYKPGSKRTLAERARELGLEPMARQLVTDPCKVRLQQAVKPDTEGLSSIKDIKTGVQHILADIISKDKEVMDTVRNCCKNTNVLVKTSRVKAPSKSKAKDQDNKVKVQLEKEAEKFSLYFEFSCNVKNIKPHQVLAINRGVSKKFLTMKIVIPDWVEQQVLKLAERLFVHRQSTQEVRTLVMDSVKDAYSRLIEPLMVRNFKSDLTKIAEKASIEVFASNLKRLLLTPPVRGKVVLGVDPGFRHGCKYAVVSMTGQVLDTGVFYPHTNTNHKWKETKKIVDVILKYSCETVAIGNGTACRETEAFFSSSIQTGAFKPLQLVFCIVSEAGASVYSASPEAIKELPDMDVSLRGAVSIARRLQDPLAELVKIEPKHIGVGMYQHDIGESQLKVALDGVVEDCVSFVGVDLNVASEVLLKRIAGLDATLAKKVISHRESSGPFINREQLKVIKGLGPKTFKQCAGFVRVLALTRGSDHESKTEATGDVAPSVKPGKKRKATARSGASNSKKSKLESGVSPDPLDMTSVHPESYSIAEKVINIAGLNKEHVGTKPFNEGIKNLLTQKSSESLTSELCIGLPTLYLITDALQQPIGHDIRDEFEKPLFKQGVRSVNDLKVGEPLTGRVTNMVHFGAFVDIGVGQDGLIHSSQINPYKLNGKKDLELGDKVTVIVRNLDLNKRRIGLSLDSLIST